MNVYCIRDEANRQTFVAIFVYYISVVVAVFSIVSSNCSPIDRAWILYSSWFNLFVWFLMEIYVMEWIVVLLLVASCCCHYELLLLLLLLCCPFSLSIVSLSVSIAVFFFSSVAIRDSPAAIISQNLMVNKNN